MRDLKNKHTGSSQKVYAPFGGPKKGVLCKGLEYRKSEQRDCNLFHIEKNRELESLFSKLKNFIQQNIPNCNENQNFYSVTDTVPRVDIFERDHIFGVF
jgi:hypothetical protein